MEDIRLLAKEEQLPSIHRTALLEAIPLTSNKPCFSAFSESLQERNASIKAVLTRIASLGSHSTPDVDQLQARCHRLGEEVSAGRDHIACAFVG